MTQYKEIKIPTHLRDGVLENINNEREKVSHIIAMAITEFTFIYGDDYKSKPKGIINFGK